MSSQQPYAKKYAISTEDSVCHIPKAGKIIIARGGLETTFEPKAGVAAHALSWKIDSLPNLKAKARKDQWQRVGNIVLAQTEKNSTTGANFIAVIIEQQLRGKSHQCAHVPILGKEIWQF